MRLTKSLLAIAAASTFAATTAFGEPVLLNEDWGYGEQEPLAESDVIYIYPMEVTEYYLIVPDSEDDAG